MGELSRRDFFRGSAIGVVSVAGLGALAGCAPKSAGQGAAEGGMTFADTIAWDAEYDVIVLGFGAAGAASARYAAKAGAKVLLIDKAPLGSEGGNTRFCGQLIQHSEDKEAMKKYFTGLAAGHDLPDDVLETYCQGLTETKNLLAEDFDVSEDNFLSWKEDNSSRQPLINYFLPEYPEIEGGEKLDLLTVSRVEQGGAHLWKAYRQKIMSLSDQIDVWLNSPAQHLIQDPISKAVIGCEIERDGKKTVVRALNGVVLTVGGFENNRAMTQTYLGLTKHSVSGTLFNTGDGIKLGAEVGADFWHMEAYETNCFIWGGVSFPLKETQHVLSGSLSNPYLAKGSYVIVGDDGQRYMSEDAIARHGHMPSNGEWIMVQRPATTYIVYDQAQADFFDSMQGIPDSFKSIVVSGNTIAELEQALHMKDGVLQQTVSGFNAAAASGTDPDFRRAPDSMRAFTQAGPYYAVEIVTAILNTQGGPRRNGNAEVLDANGDPIPHLYSAGECGGITPFQYNGGGNMAECLIFGRAAGTNAAAAKDPLPALPTKVESKPATQGSGDSDHDTDPSTIPAGDNEYIGSSQSGMGGQMIVKVTMAGGTMSKIDIIEQHETAGIGSAAVDTLPEKIVEANSADVDTVTGATMSSHAIIDAVKDALSKAPQ